MVGSSNTLVYPVENLIGNEPIYLTAVYTPGSVAPVTVTFDSRGGTLVPTVTVSSGNSVPKPESPEKTGEAFTGWYTDAACTAEAKFDFLTPVTGDLTLFAGWEIPEFNGILKLPAGLTEIGVDAFVGTAAEAVVIPESVVTIEGNPFASGSVRYIFGFGGAAKTMSETYDYRWVLIDADWLAMH